jgi:hypothetical protein
MTYAIPMVRMTDALRATTDLRVLIVGPACAFPQALAARRRAT